MKPITAKGVKKLEDVKIPKEFDNRILTGLPLTDFIFGGSTEPGFLPGAVVLFTGDPGVGKSSFLMQISDLLDTQGYKVLYNSCEEHEAMIKMAATRMELKMQFSVSQISDVNDIIETVRGNNVDVIIADSLQTLTDKTKKELSKRAIQIALTEKLVEFSKPRDGGPYENELPTVVILVGHITKDGRAAGPMDIVHLIDVHAHMSTDKDSGNRVLELKKNRYGPSHIKFEIPMTTKGLDISIGVEAAIVSSSMTEQKERSTSKSKMCYDRIVKAFNDGVHLTGYSAHELGLNVSDPTFRSALDKVVKEHSESIVTYKHDRRRYYCAKGVYNGN